MLLSCAVQVNADRDSALDSLSTPGTLLVLCSLVDNMPYVVAEAAVSTRPAQLCSPANEIASSGWAVQHSRVQHIMSSYLRPCLSGRLKTQSASFGWDIGCFLPGHDAALCAFKAA